MTEKDNGNVAKNNRIPTISVKYPTFRNEFYKTGER